VKTAIEEFHEWWRSTTWTSPRLKKAALAAWLQAWIMRGPKEDRPVEQGSKRRT